MSARADNFKLSVVSVDNLGISWQYNIDTDNMQIIDSVSADLFKHAYGTYPIIMCDNVDAISLALGPIFHACTKYLGHVYAGEVSAETYC